MNNSNRYLSALALAVCLLTQARAAVVLDNTAGWNHFDGVEIIGNGGYVTPSFGQSFTVPSGVNAINSFTFWLNDRLNTGNLRFTANLLKWNGSTGTGPLLYSSATILTSNNHGADGMEMFQLGFPGIAVTPGDQYMAFLSTLGVSSGLTGAAYVGYTGGDVMPGGRAYVNYTSTTVANAVSSGWAFLQPSVDLAFRAEFTAVPEPAAISLIGLFGCIAWCRLRKQRALK